MSPTRDDPFQAVPSKSAPSFVNEHSQDLNLNICITPQQLPSAVVTENTSYTLSLDQHQLQEQSYTAPHVFFQHAGSGSHGVSFNTLDDCGLNDTDWEYLCQIMEDGPSAHMAVASPESQRNSSQSDNTSSRPSLLHSQEDAHDVTAYVPAQLCDDILVPSWEYNWHPNYDPSWNEPQKVTLDVSIQDNQDNRPLTQELSDHSLSIHSVTRSRSPTAQAPQLYFEKADRRTMGQFPLSFGEEASTLTSRHGKRRRNARRRHALFEDDLDDNKHSSIAEKRYRNKLNSNLDELIFAVPTLRAYMQGYSGEGSVVDKLLIATNCRKPTILQKTIEYIRHLESENEKLLLGQRIAEDQGQV